MGILSLLMTILKVRTIDNETALILPPDVLQDLKLKPGDDVLAVPIGSGVMLSKCSAEIAEEVTVGRPSLPAFRTPFRGSLKP